MTPARHLRPFLLLFLAGGLIFGSFLRAQEKPPEPATPAQPAEPAKAEATADNAKAEAAKAEPPATPVPAAAPTTVTPPEPAKEAAVQAAEPPPVPQAPAEPARGKHRRHSSGGNNERVSFGSDSKLGEGQSADAVISIFGSSTSAGDVADAVVSVVGSSRVTGGTVGDAVVSVLGTSYVNGHVRGQVVAVLGNVELGPDAVVDGEIVCVGGELKRDDKAVVKGNVQNIAIGGHHFNFESLGTWFSECLLYARPLAFNSHLWWAWCVALGFLAFYALVAIGAPAGVVKCVETLEQRPGSSILAAVLALLLTPVVYILLVFTLALAIGFVLIPLFSTGLFIASIFGKVVMLAWLGRRFTRLMGDGPLAHPVFGVLIGGVLVLVLYTIPILGFVVYKLLGILGLGVVVYTLILQYKASRAARPVPPPRTVVVPAAVVAAPGVGGAGEPPVTSSPMVSAAPPVISAATLPRAGFWIRLGASVLDFVLLGIVTGMTSKVFHGWFSPGGSLPFWFAVYCVVMWSLKGTTIGGIICGLKVVRLDDRPLEWSVAIVRALGGFLSLAVAGLGFIWVSFDDERQSWHDKIAGTTIVRVPKGTALL